MSYRRVLVAVVTLAIATLACSVNLGNSPTSAPPPTQGAAATKTPVGFHNGGVTPEAPTEVQATEEPATKAPTKAPTKAATRPPKPTATEAQQQNTSCDTLK